MAIAGRVAIVPKGDYDKNASYKRLDCVKYLNVMYVAKKERRYTMLKMRLKDLLKSIIKR